jgi:hypothetical protein
MWGVRLHPVGFAGNIAVSVVRIRPAVRLDGSMWVAGPVGVSRAAFLRQPAKVIVLVAVAVVR